MMFQLKSIFWLISSNQMCCKTVFLTCIIVTLWLVRYGCTNDPQRRQKWLTQQNKFWKIIDFTYRGCTVKLYMMRWTQWQRRASNTDEGIKARSGRKYYSQVCRQQIFKTLLCSSRDFWQYLSESDDKLVKISFTALYTWVHWLMFLIGREIKSLRVPPLKRFSDQTSSVEGNISTDHFSRINASIHSMN